MQSCICIGEYIVLGHSPCQTESCICIAAVPARARSLLHIILLLLVQRTAHEVAGLTGLSHSGSHYRLSCVVYRCHRRKVGRLIKDGVESISLRACPRVRSICSSFGAGAQILRGLVGRAGVRQSVTHKLGDDFDVVRRSMVVRDLVNRRERGLLPSIKTCRKFDLWCRALSKIGRLRAGGTRIGRGRNGARIRNRVPLIIQRCGCREIGRDAENSVEGISLRARLGGMFIGCGSSRRAGCPGSLVSTAAVNESVAHELRYDIDVLCRPMVIRLLVDRLEAGLFAIVKTRAEFALWDRAAPEVSHNSSGRSTSWCWGGTS